MLDILLTGFVATVITWAQPYAQQHNHPLSVEQTRCLTEAEYFESRGEGPAGMAAVAYAVLNRTVTRHESICQVIHERGQFSFYNPHQRKQVKEAALWINATFIAVYAQLGVINNPIGNATMFTMNKMSSWLDDARYLTKVNHHFFYVMKSDLGKEILYHRQSTVITSSMLHTACLLTDPRCDPLYNRGTEALLDRRLRQILSKETDS